MVIDLSCSGNIIFNEPGPYFFFQKHFMTFYHKGTKGNAIFSFRMEEVIGIFFVFYFMVYGYTSFHDRQNYSMAVR